uniref:Ig-like domain-containing protein n=1 Tax=Mola mola TaxID=94237 RepID=A0A3Q4BZR1_MOLML
QDQNFVIIWVLLTVETEQTMFKSEFGGDVVMGCRFQPKLSNPQDPLKVTWHWISGTSSREVYRMDDRMEVSASQDPAYRGRVTLLTEELKDGWAKLKVSKLRIGDSGTYQCLVQTKEGADYKDVTLSVAGPYKTVTKHFRKAAKGDELLLSCESEGYPESSVTWQDGHLQRIDPSTTAVSTPEQLFKVTSEIHVPSWDKNNYTCSFTNDGISATFHIPDETPIPLAKNDTAFILLAIAGIAVVIVAVLIYRQRKGDRSINSSCGQSPKCSRNG